MSHEKFDVTTRGYRVKMCDERDDAGFITARMNRIYRLAPLTSMCFIGLNWIYLGFRIKFTMNAQNFAHTTYFMAWVLVLIEMRFAGE